MLEFIDTRHGTDNQPNFSNGNTLPITAMPFGMNHFAIQNDDQSNWFFNPQLKQLQGIRLTHQPSPWMGDFSHFLLTPVVGNPDISSAVSCQSSYRPEESIFKPHYLKFSQLRFGLTTELTPSERGCQLKITSLEEQLPISVLLRAKGESSFNIDNTGKILSGYVSNYAGCQDKSFKMYIYLSFNHFMEIRNEETTNKISDEKEQTIVIKMKENFSEPLLISMATSFVSVEQARLNAERELKRKFEDTKQIAQQKWESYLKKIEISQENKEYVQTFYQCLYRTFLYPQKFYEISNENEAIHYNTSNSCVEKGILYTNNGFWDTYKTVYPLYSLIAPEMYKEILLGFLTTFKETGFLPKWLSPDERGMMPGTLADAVIADATVKGLLSTEELEDYLHAMLTTANVESENKIYGRQGLKDYEELGYVSTNYHESVNHTLDYAYSDYCISQVAVKAGKKKIAKKYREKSLRYKNLFDLETGFMRGKNRTGHFRKEFCDSQWGTDYTEGSAWQNSFGVYHDIQGLINLYQSPTIFIEKITELVNSDPIFSVGDYGFEIHEMSEMAALKFGQMAISNQPSFHLPYLFTFAGEPHSSQVLLKQLMRYTFSSDFKGFPGDDDNGSMSGWFVFNAMGFYPVTPGCGEYVLGIPLFDKIIIHTSENTSFTIKSKNNSQQANFVTDINLNGEKYSKFYLSHDLLTKNNLMEVRMGIIPKKLSYQQSDLPFSLTNE